MKQAYRATCGDENASAGYRYRKCKTVRRPPAAAQIVAGNEFGGAYGRAGNSVEETAASMNSYRHG
ncbi:hypothetical protein KCP70_07560 [Salmonella enterica subsp. enterica]|nr:hypothetical protein KCP70_07560 [Salmonella enterica subsp. enterica]